MDENKETREVSISIRGVKKRYRLGQIGGGTLQEDLQAWWAKIRGKENPNLPIGLDSRLIGQTFMALNGVDLTVYKGEALGIIGSNGAGKSTLLKLLSRITAPTEGEIDIYGRISSMLEVGTGFNGQLTGRENVYMNGAILGMSRAEIDEKMEDIIEFSEVREFIDTPVKRYSSGMFVKLAFAVAAHLKNDIMIMDEVLAVGDMAFQKKCLKKMRESATEQGRTVLYVSHNMNTIRELCSRCVVMDQGKIVFDGDVEEAITIYMKNSIGENEVEIDLGSKARTVNGVDFGIRMDHLSLLGKSQPRFDNTEPLALRLTFRVTRPIREAQLRLTFRTEGDIALGTVWSNPLSFPETGRATADFAFPLNGFMNGELYCSIGFCYMDDLGRRRLLDHIPRAFRIEVDPTLGGTFWSTNAYGYQEFKGFEGKIIGYEQCENL